MVKNPIRRSQLIAPFGVGAMVVVQAGVGLLTAGLGHWYERENAKGDVEVEEYIVREWRLERLLDVTHFRLPPDYRERWRYGNQVPNTELTIPFHRFPRWHFCSRCGLLDERPLSERSRPKCPECESPMFQVPFVSICESGHLQDFPWREWVHRQSHPECAGSIRLKATGSASLAGQKLICDACGKKRNLWGVTIAYPDGSTYLGKNLTNDGTPFYCPGHLTWLGEGVTEKCTAHLRGSLRSASNVYFAHVYSSIYLPRGNETIPGELIDLFAKPPLSTLVNTLLGVIELPTLSERVEKAVDSIIEQDRYKPTFFNYSRDQVVQAAHLVFVDQNKDDFEDNGFIDEEDFRYEEYKVLQREASEEVLKISGVTFHDYDRDIVQYFSQVMLVDKLRETRVMTGFTRVFATNEQTLSRRKTMLRKRTSNRSDWLPAYVVYGEGIFFKFDEQRLVEWERTPEIILRIKKLNSRYKAVQQNRHLDNQEITPRFVLLHTFSHLLMNRLTFECGYSSAALRERLYVSSDATHPMAGLLIYTAAGDADGTMGGLVRMGKHGYIEPVIWHALQDATWCSADPVCTEIGGSGGQGPDSCNLAACHNCALVPETACEHFNRFLDRVTVVGDIKHPSIGYFSVHGDNRSNTQ